MGPKFQFYQGVIMGSVFLLFGCLIMIAPPENKIVRDNNLLIGIILLAYGAFRLQRGLMAKKRM